MALQNTLLCVKARICFHNFTLNYNLFLDVNQDNWNNLGIYVVVLTLNPILQFWFLYFGSLSESFITQKSAEIKYISAYLNI